jgi:multiple sugar transport system permease protein
MQEVARVSTASRPAMTILARPPETGRSKVGRPLSDGMFALLLTLPGVALFLGIVLYPLASSLITSLFRQSLVLPGREFVGLDNFQHVLSGDLFRVLRNTVVFTLGSTIFPFLIGLALALALNQRVRGATLLRGVFLMPWVIPTVVASFLWLWIFNANYGVLNGFLVQYGVLDSNAVWLGQPSTAMAAVIIAKTWASFPWIMVMLLAGLQTVPVELQEAAAIDGAGAIRRFFAITLPHLKGVIGIVLLLEVIWNFHHFDIIYVLTGGGPAGSTTTFAVGVYQTAFRGFDLGRAGAMGVFWMIILSLLVVVYLRVMERSERR